MAQTDTKGQGNNQVEVDDHTPPKNTSELTGFTGTLPAAVAPATPAATPAEPPKPSAAAVAAATGTTPAAAATTAEAPKAKAAEDAAPKSATDKTADNALADAAAKSKFFDNEWQQMLLRQAWKVDDIDSDTQKVIKALTEDKKNGCLCFQTDHGKFDWGTDGEGNEYIGRRGLFNRLTQELADEEALVAKARGWKSVEVHGSTGNKDKLWLAAKRAGLEVGNYTPKEDSPAFETWKKESGELTGYKQDPAKPDAPKADAAKPEEAKAEAPKAEAPKADAAKPETAKAETAKAETPAATAPVASKFGGADAAKPAAPQAQAPAVVDPNKKVLDTLAKHAAAAKDPAHKEGVQKLHDAIKSGKIEVKSAADRELINHAGSPKGYQRAADYFSASAPDAKLNLPKISAPAAETAPRVKQNKGPA